MTLKFTTSEEASALNGVKVLVYGGPGMGKTVLTATAPSPLVIAAEPGMLSLKRKNLERLFGVNTPGITYSIPTIEIDTVDDLTEAHRWCRDSAEAKPFETICLDSLSEIAEVVLNNAKRQVKDPRQAYGELMEKMDTSVRAFRDLQGKNVYMSSKLAKNKDEHTGVIRYGPSMPGNKVGESLPYLFDEVFRLGINQDQNGRNYRFLQTQPDYQYDAKDRSGSLDDVEYPSLTNIFNKILGAQ